MNRFLVTIMLAATVILTLPVMAFAETLTGEVKAIALESKVFSLITGQKKYQRPC
jgi:hypothetical protein